MDNIVCTKKEMHVFTNKAGVPERGSNVGAPYGRAPVSEIVLDRITRPIIEVA